MTDAKMPPVEAKKCACGAQPRWVCEKCVLFTCQYPACGAERCACKGARKHWVTAPCEKCSRETKRGSYSAEWYSETWETCLSCGHSQDHQEHR